MTSPRLTGPPVVNPPVSVTEPAEVQVTARVTVLPDGSARIDLGRFEIAGALVLADRRSLATWFTAAVESDDVEIAFTRE